MNEMLKDLIGILMAGLQAAIIAVIPVVIPGILKYFKAKRENVSASTDNEFLKTVLSVAEDIVNDVVTAVSQTYVEALKKDGAFNKEEQEMAFQLAYNAAKNIISEEHQAYLGAVLGSFEEWLSTLIEATVNRNKRIEPEEG